MFECGVSLKEREKEKWDGAVGFDIGLLCLSIVLPQ